MRYISRADSSPSCVLFSPNNMWLLTVWTLSPSPPWSDRRVGPNTGHLKMPPKLRWAAQGCFRGSSGEAHKGEGGLPEPGQVVGSPKRGENSGTRKSPPFWPQFSISGVGGAERDKQKGRPEGWGNVQLRENKVTGTPQSLECPRSLQRIHFWHNFIWFGNMKWGCFSPGYNWVFPILD